MEKSDYIKKVEGEISHLLQTNKKYWFDFNVSTKDKNDILKYFGSKYSIEIKSCLSCGGTKHDVIINI